MKNLNSLIRNIFLVLVFFGLAQSLPIYAGANPSKPIKINAGMTLVFYQNIEPMSFTMDLNPKLRLQHFINEQLQETQNLSTILTDSFNKNNIQFKILRKYSNLGVIIAKVKIQNLSELTLPSFIEYHPLHFLNLPSIKYDVVNDPNVREHFSNESINYKKLYPKLGKNTNLFILDTGIKSNHKEFSGVNVLYHDSTRDLVDRNGHGSHVAATAVGVKAGFATNANLYIDKIVSDSGYSDDDKILTGLNWVVKKCSSIQGNCILSLSVGGEKDLLQNKIINLLNRLGVLVIAAAGNEASDACEYSPSSAEGALTVSSANIFTSTLSFFSNYGPCVNMVADGENIVSAWKPNNDSYKALSGTSMAAPHVAGIAALIWSEQPEMSNLQLKMYLISLSRIWIFGYPLSI